MSLNRQPKPKTARKSKPDLSGVADDLNFGTEPVQQDIKDSPEKPVQQEPSNLDDTASEQGYHRDADGRLKGKNGNPIGRPRKGSKKRTIQKHITCNAEEADLYMRAAEKEGLLFPEFARKAIEKYIDDKKKEEENKKKDKSSDDA